MYLEFRILAPECKPVSRLVSKVVDSILSEMKYDVKPKTTEIPAWGCRYSRVLGLQADKFVSRSQFRIDGFPCHCHISRKEDFEEGTALKLRN